jgi:hypothetical protein
VIFELSECGLAEAISVAWELPEGHVVANHICTKANSMWLLYTEPDPLRRSVSESTMVAAAADRYAQFAALAAARGFAHRPI